jgi:hypothetical protein
VQLVGRVGREIDGLPHGSVSLEIQDDLVASRRQRQILEEAVEVVDNAGVVAVYVNGRLLWRDEQANPRARVVYRKVRITVRVWTPPRVRAIERVVEISTDEDDATTYMPVGSMAPSRNTNWPGEQGYERNDNQDAGAMVPQHDGSPQGKGSSFNWLDVLGAEILPA